MPPQERGGASAAQDELPSPFQTCGGKGVSTLIHEGATTPARRRLTLEGTPDLTIDGTERRRQRPEDPAAQQAHYSSKKKTHTDKSILLI